MIYKSVEGGTLDKHQVELKSEQGQSRLLQAE